jgi:tetratricopeptide (TPR) repeat protein
MGEEAKSRLTSTNSLAVVYRNQGRYEQAEALLRSVLDVERRTLGEQHPDTLGSMVSLGLVYGAQAKYAQAETLFSQSLQARRRLLGEEHPSTLGVMYNLAEIYRRQSRLQEAESLFNQVLEGRRRVLGWDNPNTTNALAALGGMKLEHHEYTEAETLLRQALRSYEKTDSDTWRRYYTQSMLGASLDGLGKYAEAERLLISGYEALSKKQESIPSENRPALGEVRGWIGNLYRDWGKLDEALAWVDRISKP